MVPVVFLARPPRRMEPQPPGRALCSGGSHHCYTLTVLIVVCLSDLATKRQKRAVGSFGGPRQSQTELCTLKIKIFFLYKISDLCSGFDADGWWRRILLSRCCFWWHSRVDKGWCVEIQLSLLAWLDYRESESRRPDHSVSLFHGGDALPQSSGTFSNFPPK